MKALFAKRIRVDETVNKWFEETFERIERQLKRGEDIDKILVSSLQTGESYCKATLLLLQNNYLSPSKALLRILSELTAKLLWCLFIPDNGTNRINETIQERIDRWKKNTVLKSAKELEEFSDCFSADRDNLKKEAGKLRMIANEINHNEMPNVKQIFKDLPEPWYKEIYARTYWQFNSAIHPDLKMLGELIEQHGKSIVCRSEGFNDSHELFKYSIVCAYHLNFLVRNHYDWPFDEMERQCNAMIDYFQK